MKFVSYVLFSSTHMLILTAIGHNSLITVSDQLQDLQVTITIVHVEESALADAGATEGFVLGGPLDKVKPKSPPPKDTEMAEAKRKREREEEEPRAKRPRHAPADTSIVVELE